MSLHHHLRNQAKRLTARNPQPVDTLAIALDGAAKCSPQEIDDLLHILHQCSQALHRGCATQLQWGIMAGSCTLARAVEDLGTVKGLRGHIDTCEKVLHTLRARYVAAPQSVSERRAGWGKTGLHFDEADAIKTFVDVHNFQLRQLSRAEFTKAANLATARANSAGETVEVVRDVQAFARERVAA
jgi:hypothetical protein